MNKKYYLLILALFISGIAILPFQLYSQQREPQLDLNDAYLQMDRSPEGLAHYKFLILKRFKEIEAKGVKSVHTTITLQEPISALSAEQLVEEFGLKPTFIYAFAYSKAGELITIGGQFKGGLHRGLQDVVENEDADLLGVVSMVASVHTTQLASLQNDHRVFLADISADQNLVHNPGNRDYMHHFAWDLYHQRNGSAEKTPFEEKQ